MLILKIPGIFIIEDNSTSALKVPTYIILLIVIFSRSPKYSSMIIERIGNRQIEGCCYEVITPLATIATTEKYKILNDVLLLKEYSA